MDFNPFAPADEDTWAVMETLRRDCPIYSPSPGMQYVALHADVARVLREAKTFGPISRSLDPTVEVPVEDRMVNELDGTDHIALRHVLVGALSPARIRRAEAGAVLTARRLLDEIGSGPNVVDLAGSYVSQLPRDVTLRVLGLPIADAPLLAEWSRLLLDSPWQATNQGPYGHGIGGTVPDLAAYMLEKIRECAARSEKDDTVLSEVTTARIDGERLSEARLVTLMVNLLLGGVGSTSNSVGNVMWELLRSEELYGRVHADRSLVSVAVEEGLRHRAPVPCVARAVSQGVALSGGAVEQGEKVVLGLSSANRDDVFEHADRFDLDRPNIDQHVAFGAGVHVCVGAAFARMVARVAVDVFLDRFAPGSVRLVESEYTPVTRFMEWGPQTIRVELLG